MQNLYSWVRFPSWPHSSTKPFLLRNTLLFYLPHRVPNDIMRSMSRRSWTIDQLEEAVRKSRSLRQVLREIGLRPAGGNYVQLQKYISELGLETSHFTGRSWNKGLKTGPKPRIPITKILVKNSQFQSYKLKNRLFREGFKQEHCESCGWSERSSGGYLPLELDHINGDRHDNRIENLRILCPNCHSLTPTYRSRRRK